MFFAYAIRQISRKVSRERDVLFYNSYIFINFAHELDNEDNNQYSVNSNVIV